MSSKNLLKLDTSLYAIAKITGSHIDALKKFIKVPSSRRNDEMPDVPRLSLIAI